MTIGTRLFTWLKGEKVGEDVFGNRYYRERHGARRWVLYKGAAEASMVPAEWHGWLHHTLDQPPTEAPPRRWPWQKPHAPNLTGTESAYRPAGSLQRGARRPDVSADYEPWRPDASAAP